MSFILFYSSLPLFSFMLTFIAFSLCLLTKKLLSQVLRALIPSLFIRSHIPSTLHKSFRTLLWSIHIHTLHKRTTVAIALLIAHFMDAPKSKLHSGPSVVCVWVCVLWHMEKLPVFSMCKFSSFPFFCTFVLLFRVFLCCAMSWHVCLCMCVSVSAGKEAQR